MLLFLREFWRHSKNTGAFIGSWKEFYWPLRNTRSIKTLRCEETTLTPICNNSDQAMICSYFQCENETQKVFSSNFYINILYFLPMFFGRYSLWGSISDVMGNTQHVTYTKLESFESQKFPTMEKLFCKKFDRKKISSALCIRNISPFQLFSLGVCLPKKKIALSFRW